MKKLYFQNEGISNKLNLHRLKLYYFYFFLNLINFNY